VPTTAPELNQFPMQWVTVALSLEVTKPRC